MIYCSSIQQWQRRTRAILEHSSRSNPARGAEVVRVILIDQTQPAPDGYQAPDPAKRARVILVVPRSDAVLQRMTTRPNGPCFHARKSSAHD